MTLPQLFAGGKPIRLDKRIGKGGEGEVYTLADHSGFAVKYYTLKDLASREAKILAMVRAKLAEQFKLVAFPTATVADQNKRFAGFIMRLVSNCKPLHELYAPASRKHHFPAADYRFITRSALNITRAIAQVHDSGCVVGDINHSGVLVSQQAMAALIDADSFQITEGDIRHLCKVGVPEYTPPELQGQKLDSIVRTPNHDNFGLAIVIFQLLFMGRHPFSGRFNGQGDMPMEKAIGEFRFAYSLKRDTGMSSPPGASDLRDIPPWLADMFEQAFAPTSRDQRPTAAQWAIALERFESTLIKCTTNGLHHHSNAAKSCPWCDMEQNIGLVLFIPDATKFTAHVFTGGKFDAEVLWRQIEALNLQGLVNLPPPWGQVSGRISPEVKLVRKNRKLFYIKRFAIVAGAILLVILNPLSFLYFIGAAIICWFVNEATNKEIQPFQEKFRNTTEEWDNAVTHWRASLNLPPLAERYANVYAWKQEYQGLTGEHAGLTNEIARIHKEHQLEDYLEGFDIAGEIAKGRLKVNGLGRGKQAALVSYNIETFADVNEDDCLAVPGIGNAITSGLVAYRQKLCANFRPSSQMSAAEKQDRMKLDMEFQARAKTLQARLEAGSVEIARHASRAKALVTQRNMPLETARQALLDAIEDLKYLGHKVNIPTQPPPPNPFTTLQSYSPSNRSYTSSRPQTTSRPALATPSCPNCQSRMVKRMNRRRGNAFWGCSTYPICRGTRNYP